MEQAIILMMVFANRITISNYSKDLALQWRYASLYAILKFLFGYFPNSHNGYNHITKIKEFFLP